MRVVLGIFLTTMALNNTSVANTINGYKLTRCHQTFCLKITSDRAEISKNSLITNLDKTSLDIFEKTQKRQPKFRHISKKAYIDHELDILVMTTPQSNEELIFDLNTGEIKNF